MYRSQYLVPVVVAACQELGIGNLYLKRTQVCLLHLLREAAEQLSLVQFDMFCPCGVYGGFPGMVTPRNQPSMMPVVAHIFLGCCFW